MLKGRTSRALADALDTLADVVRTTSGGERDTAIADGFFALGAVTVGMSRSLDTLRAA